MEDFWEKRTATTNGGATAVNPKTIKEQLEELKEKDELRDRREKTLREQEQWNFPKKWNKGFRKSTGKFADDKILVIVLNQKQELEPPVLVPIFSGNIIIYKNKAYDFDPRAVLTIKYKKKIVRVVLIRTIDRRPFCNLDWGEVRARGDGTDSDEILLKMVTKAMIEKQKKPFNKGIIVVIVIAVIIGIIFFLWKG